MKEVCIIFWIAISLSIPCSFAQLISTTETPSQGSYEAGINLGSIPSTETPSQGSFEVGAKQMTSRSLTPSQATFALRNATLGGSEITQMYNINIANALKEGDIP